jgi:peptide/nickel transport system substrate-binding protein
MKNRTIARAALWLLVAVSVLAIACGGSDDDDESSGAGASGTAAGVAATAAAGAATAAATQAADFNPNATLRFAFGTNGGSNYDPHTAPNQFVYTFLYPAYDRLIAQTDDGKLEGQLAQSFSFQDGGRALQLKLRQNVVFHDGAAFTAEAVKANLERAKNNPRSTLKADMSVVESVEAVDPSTVLIKFNAPAASFPALLADRSGMMISPNALNNQDLDLKPVGAGPYRVVDHQPGKVIAYEKFDKYWDPSVQKVNRIEISMVLDPDTRLRSLRSGEIDASGLNADQIRDAERANLKVTTDGYVGAFILYLNTSRSEFQNAKVRQALATAIDRKSISEALHAGKCPPTSQIFPANYWAADPNIKADYYKYDADAAKKLLAEAGLPNGFSFTAIVINVPYYSSQAEAIQAQLAKIGVKMEVQTVEPAQLLARFVTEKTADAYFSTTGGFIDPAKLVAQLYLPNSSFNPGGYTNPRITESAAKGLESTDQAQRATAYQQLSKVVTEEALHIPVCSGVNVTVTTNKVQNFKSNGQGAYEFRGVSIAR